MGTTPLQEQHIEREVAELIVEALNLEIHPSNIVPNGALFGTGLGLDSIDSLELALVISNKYGVSIKEEDADRNRQIFGSLRALSAFISENRKR